jgi:hypothetical protein
MTLRGLSAWAQTISFFSEKSRGECIFGSAQHLGMLRVHNKRVVNLGPAKLSPSKELHRARVGHCPCDFTLFVVSIQTSPDLGVLLGKIHFWDMHFFRGVKGF